MRKVLYILLFLVSFNGLLATNNGVIDLREADFSKELKLTGLWEFYWKKLLTPQEIQSHIYKADYIYVNSTWNNYRYKGKKVGGNGYATYHVKILLPSKGQYVIKFRQILSCYRVWINGKLYSEVGHVDTAKNLVIPVVKVNEIFFYTSTDTVDIVVQVANFHHKAGGIQELVSFGKPNVIKHQAISKVLYEFFVAGAELMFALYFLFSFFFRQKDYTMLLFSIAIVLSIIFDLVNTEMILMKFFPNIPFEIEKKIDFFSDYSRLLFFSLFLWQTFKPYNVAKNTGFYIIGIFSLILSLLVLFTPCIVYSKFLEVFMAGALISFIYFLVVVLRALKGHFKIFITSAIGIFILFLGSINDSLFNLNLIHTGYFISTSLLFFFLGHSITLSFKFSEISVSVSELSKRFEIYESLTKEFLKIVSYELDKILTVLLQTFDLKDLTLYLKGSDLHCECFKHGDHIVCEQRLQHCQRVISKNIISQLNQNKIVRIKQGDFLKMYFAVKDNGNIKSVICFEIKKNQAQRFESILSLLFSQIDTFIDNYIYYNNLEMLNKNLEVEIERRTQIVVEQKNQILQKGAELSEKIEELNVASQLTETMNKELEMQQKIILNKNKLLEQYKKQILEQKAVLEEKEKHIRESIEYAVKIHRALFEFYQDFPIDDYFVYISQRDLVSGDFFTTFKGENHWLLAVVDTTGINVSATFLTILLNSLIEDIILANPEVYTNPAKLVKIVKNQFIESLNVGVSEEQLNDSFTISVTSIDFSTGNLTFSGFMQPVVIIRKGDIIVLDSEGFSFEEFDDNSITEKKLALKAGDTVYLFTDGFYNQIGDKTHKRLGKSKFIQLLKTVSVYSFDKQKQELQRFYDQWRGRMKKIDDFLIVSFRYKLD